MFNLVGDFGVVGLSKPRNHHFSGLLIKEKLQQKQAEARCGILIIDLKTGNIVEWLDRDTEATELYDVAIFPQVQCPMVLGFKSGNIAKLVTIHSFKKLNNFLRKKLKKREIKPCLVSLRFSSPSPLFY